MEYFLNQKVTDKKILLEILQNRFTKFDESVVQWTFGDSRINSEFLENKILNNYKNKLKKCIF